MTFQPTERIRAAGGRATHSEPPVALRGFSVRQDHGGPKAIKAANERHIEIVMPFVSDSHTSFAVAVVVLWKVTTGVSSLYNSLMNQTNLLIELNRFKF